MTLLQDSKDHVAVVRSMAAAGASSASAPKRVQAW
jgi:hypothetical protein